LPRVTTAIFPDKHCSDLIRDALREKLRRDAPERFKLLFEGVHTEQEDEKIAAK
jgi:hypothetical protein